MKVAVFSSKPYDRQFLDAANRGRHELRYVDCGLTASTTALAKNAVRRLSVRKRSSERWDNQGTGAHGRPADRITLGRFRQCRSKGGSSPRHRRCASSGLFAECGRRACFRAAAQPQSEGASCLRASAAWQLCAGWADGLRSGGEDLRYHWHGQHWLSRGADRTRLRLQRACGRSSSPRTTAAASSNMSSWMNS